MRHLFGYPVSMYLQVDGGLLDVSAALKVNDRATGVEVDIECVLDLIQEHEERR